MPAMALPTLPRLTLAILLLMSIPALPLYAWPTRDGDAHADPNPNPNPSPSPPDWLLSPPASLPASAELSDDGHVLTLSNGLVQRQFFVGAPGAFCTIELQHLRTAQTFFRALSPEANITLNGTAYNIGACSGQAAGHFEFFPAQMLLPTLQAASGSMVLQSYQTSEPVAPFPWQPQRHAPSVPWPPPGVQLTARFVPPSGAPAALAGVTVDVHYALFDGLPVFKKWVSVRAAGNSTVVVDSLVYETLRAPNYAPPRMTVVTQHANNPVPFPDQQVVPETTQSFPGRTTRFWYFDPLYDQGGDQEVHVPYTYYTLLVVGYGVSVTYGGPTGPGYIVSGQHNTTFVSLAVHLVLHDSDSVERQGLAVRQLGRLLTPQVTETPLRFMVTDISSSSAMRAAVDQGAAAGFELMIIGFGAAGYCGLCQAELGSDTWKAWFKGEIAYANARGLEVTAYTLMQHNGWGETTPPAEQTLSPSGVRGPTACFATDWHAAYRAAVLALVDEVGLSGLETDGQYEQIPCADTGGDHRHNGLAGGFSYGLEATLDFNEKLKATAKGGYQSGADAYVFSGANVWNAADTDAFGRLPLLEQHTVGRMYVYDSTINRLAASSTIGVNDLSAAASACPGTYNISRLDCMDFVLGTYFGMGIAPTFRSGTLFPAADPQAASLNATIAKWTAFYRRLRGPRPSGAPGLLVANTVHLRRPDSRHMEALLHLSPDSSAADRGLLLLVNPQLPGSGGGVLSARLQVPLYYAALQPGQTVHIQPLAEASSDAGLPAAGATATVGAGSEIVLQPSLEPFSFALLLITVAEQ